MRELVMGYPSPLWDMGNDNGGPWENMSFQRDVMNGPVLEVAPGTHQGKPSVSVRVNKLTQDTWLTIMHVADRFITI